jgi:putative hydrolases of HD superfamily
MTQISPAQVLEFYRIAEKLKTTLRHSWLNDGVRQESVAEHTWMMSLLALVLLPHMKQKLDTQKVLTMIIVHDLAEAVTTDMPVWEGVKNKAEKFEAEKQAIEGIFSNLDDKTRKSLMEVWEEYEVRKSPEALFVKALDALDVIVQHNVAPIETWDKNDYLWQLSPLQHSFFQVNELLQQIKAKIDEWSIEKATKAGTLPMLDQQELQKRSH